MLTLVWEVTLLVFLPSRKMEDLECWISGMKEWVLFQLILINMGGLPKDVQLFSSEINYLRVTPFTCLLSGLGEFTALPPSPAPDHPTPSLVLGYPWKGQDYLVLKNNTKPSRAPAIILNLKFPKFKTWKSLEILKAPLSLLLLPQTRVNVFT